MSKGEELKELLDLSNKYNTRMNNIFLKRKMTTPELNKLPDEEREEWLKLHDVFKGISDKICNLINN